MTYSYYLRKTLILLNKLFNDPWNDMEVDSYGNKENYKRIFSRKGEAIPKNENFRVCCPIITDGLLYTSFLFHMTNNRSFWKRQVWKNVEIAGPVVQIFGFDPGENPVDTPNGSEDYSFFVDEYIHKSRANSNRFFEGNSGVGISSLPLDPFICTDIDSYEYVNKICARSIYPVKIYVFGSSGDGGTVFSESNELVKFRCINCGNVFEREICFYKTLGRYDRYFSCPYCNHNISNGELAVMEWLKGNRISYIYGYISHARYKSNLHFDFWLPKQRVAIEYDGQQHFKPVDYWGGKKAFKIEKKRDHIKNRYCKSHHIKLIRIPYYKSVNRVLNAKLKSSAK